MNNLWPGDIIDERYRIICTLGEGGMGSVYKAEEIGLGRVVALKCLQPGLTGDEEQRQRFAREGKALSTLSHKNLITFYRLGFWQNQSPYIAMEFLSGKSLLEVIQQEGSLKPTRALNLILQVCAGMEHAHRNGIIHRDLKPGNVMLVESESELVKVVDFGLARMREVVATQGLTQTGALVGSIHYMSPEQCAGKKADARSDIYAIGCILFETLTGRPPFDAANPVALLHLHSTEPVPEIGLNANEKRPAGLDTVVQKALCKNPDDRYQTLNEMQQDIELLLAGKSELIAAAPGQHSVKQQNIAKPLVLAGVLLTAICLLTAIQMRSTSNKLELHTQASHTKKSVDTRTEMHQIFHMAQGDAVTTAQLEQAVASTEECLTRIKSNDAALKMQGCLLCSWLCDRLIILDQPKKQDAWRARGIAVTKQALDCVQGLNVRCEAVALSRLGELFAGGRDFETAKAYFLEALAIAEKRSPSPQFVLDSDLPGGQANEETVFLMGQLGVCCRGLKEYKEAEKWLLASIKESDRINESLQSTAMNNLKILFDVYIDKGKQNRIEQLVRETEKKISQNLSQGLISDSAASSFYALLSYGPVRTSNVKDCLRLCTLSVKHLDAAADPATFRNVGMAITSSMRIARNEHDEQALLELENLQEKATRVSLLRKR